MYLLIFVDNKKMDFERASSFILKELKVWIIVQSATKNNVNVSGVQEGQEDTKDPKVNKDQLDQAESKAFKEPEENKDPLDEQD
jgi:hypothetical protein